MRDTHETEFDTSQRTALLYWLTLDFTVGRPWRMDELVDFFVGFPLPEDEACEHGHLYAHTVDGQGCHECDIDRATGNW